MESHTKGQCRRLEGASVCLSLCSPTFSSVGKCTFTTFPIVLNISSTCSDCTLRVRLRTTTMVGVASVVAAPVAGADPDADADAFESPPTGTTFEAERERERDD